MIDEKQPQNLDVERSILGAMLIDKKGIESAVELLSPENFFDTSHQILFGVLSSLFKDNIPIDQLTVVEKLEKEDKLYNVSEATIAALMAETATAANIEYHCGIIKKHSVRRQTIQSLTGVITLCRDGKEEPDTILDNLQLQLSNISETHTEKGYTANIDAMVEAFDEIEELHQNPNKLRGVTSGLPELDKYTRGWQGGDLIVIGGLTSSGKSSFALNLAVSAAKSEVPVAFFSMEMSVKQLGMKQIASESMRPVLNPERLQDDDWEILTHFCSRLSNYPIFTDETPALTLPKLLAKLRRMIREQNIGLAVIDYLQLMKGTTNESRRLEVESISRGLKQYAKTFNIPIIALSQFSRKADERIGEPKLSDLRESGSIEQDSDIVIFVHSPDINDTSKEIDCTIEEAKNIRQIIIRKSRMNERGSIYVRWDGQYSKFSTLYRD
jgi:replicative DNA helicase